MDYSNYSSYPDPQNQQQTVQAIAYDPSQPSHAYDPSTTTTAGAAQSSSYYYYDTQSQQYAPYNPSQDYAAYYYPQHQQQLQETSQQQLQESRHQKQTQLIQQYGQALHEVYTQPVQNPGFEFSQNLGGIPQTPISHLTGHFPDRGRGRGRGGGGRRGGGRFSRGGRGNFGKRLFTGMASTEPSNSGITPPSKPPRMEWCELCRVECNTPEILEQHRQGKRHLKNVKVQEELQNLKQTTTSIVETVPVEAEQQAEKPEVTETESSVPKDEEKTTNERLLGKRKMKTGREGKFVKTAKRLVEPPPPKKQAVLYLCELCNAKCETQMILDKHLTGKKHLSNLKKAQKHGGYGEAAGLQAVYPHTSSATATLLAPPVQQGAAELGSILAAHGVTSNESQALLAQLIMNYVVSQTQGVGALPQPPTFPVPDIGMTHHLQYSIPKPYVVGAGIDSTTITTAMVPPGGVVGTGSVVQAAPSIPESHSVTVIETEMKPMGSS